MKRGIDTRLGKLERRCPRQISKIEPEKLLWEDLQPLVEEYTKSLDGDDRQEWKDLLEIEGDFASIEEYLRVLSERQLRLLEVFLVRYDPWGELPTSTNAGNAK